MMVEMISKMIVRDNGGDGGEDYFRGNDDDDDFCDGHGGDYDRWSDDDGDWYEGDGKKKEGLIDISNWCSDWQGHVD